MADKALKLSRVQGVLRWRLVRKHTEDKFPKTLKLDRPIVRSRTTHRTIELIKLDSSALQAAAGTEGRQKQTRVAPTTGQVRVLSCGLCYTLAHGQKNKTEIHLRYRLRLSPIPASGLCDCPCRFDNILSLSNIFRGGISLSSHESRLRRDSARHQLSHGHAAI